MQNHSYLPHLDWFMPYKFGQEASLVDTSLGVCQSRSKFISICFYFIDPFYTSLSQTQLADFKEHFTSKPIIPRNLLYTKFVLKIKPNDQRPKDVPVLLKEVCLR